jgi:hypothetical protein
MLPSLDCGNKRLGRQEEAFRVNFGLLIAAKLLSPRPLDVAGRADEVEAVCRHEALQMMSRAPINQAASPAEREAPPKRGSEQLIDESRTYTNSRCLANACRTRAQVPILC